VQRPDGGRWPLVCGVAQFRCLEIVLPPQTPASPSSECSCADSGETITHAVRACLPVQGERPKYCAEPRPGPREPVEIARPDNGLPATGPDADDAEVAPSARGEEPAAVLVAEEKSGWIRTKASTARSSLSEVPAIPAASQGAVARTGRRGNQLGLGVVRDRDPSQLATGKGPSNHQRTVRVRAVAREDDAVLGKRDGSDLVAVAMVAAGQDDAQNNTTAARTSGGDRAL
jgi:hypothetical protein